MIALSGHGLWAIRSVPSLHRDYVSHVGVAIKSVSVWLGGKEMTSNVGDAEADDEAYIVDRNYVCAAIARFLHEHHGDNHAGRQGILLTPSS